MIAAPQEPLVLALAQAHHWQETLDAGKVENAAALAKRLHVSRGYVTSTLRLNYLAPDIVQAILDGREPSGISLVKLTQPPALSDHAVAGSRRGCRLNGPNSARSLGSKDDPAPRLQRCHLLSHRVRPVMLNSSGRFASAFC